MTQTLRKKLKTITSNVKKIRYNIIFSYSYLHFNTYLCTMKKHVAIIVTGQAASGKSTVMHLIEKLLRKEGFIVEIDLDGNHDYKNLNDFNMQMSTNEAKRFQAVKENTKIMIKEMPMRNVPTVNKKYENKVKAN